MRFYSDKTNKFYDTLQLCEAAEREFDKQNESKTKNEEDLAEEYEHAYATLCDANKKYSTVLTQSEEEVAKVLKEAKEKIKKARIELSKAQEEYDKAATAYNAKAVYKDSNSDDWLQDFINLYSNFFF